VAVRCATIKHYGVAGAAGAAQAPRRRTL